MSFVGAVELADADCGFRHKARVKRARELLCIQLEFSLEQQPNKSQLRSLGVASENP